MALVLKIVASTLLLLVILAGLAITIVPRFLDRIFDNFLCARCLWQLAHRDHIRTTFDKLLNFESNFSKVNL